MVKKWPQRREPTATMDRPSNRPDPDSNDRPFPTAGEMDRDQACREKLGAQYVKFCGIAHRECFTPTSQTRE